MKEKPLIYVYVCSILYLSRISMTLRKRQSGEIEVNSQIFSIILKNDLVEENVCDKVQFTKVTKAYAEDSFDIVSILFDFARHNSANPSI